MARLARIDLNQFPLYNFSWSSLSFASIPGFCARGPDHAAALGEKLALGEEELADWRDAVERIVTGLDPASGIYEQFAGFHVLEPLDLAAYADRTVPIDVVIGRERTQRSQVVKQSDVVDSRNFTCLIPPIRVR